MSTYNLNKVNAVRLSFTLGKLKDGTFDSVAYRQIEVIIPASFTIDDLALHLSSILDNVLYLTHREAHPHGNS